MNASLDAAGQLKCSNNLYFSPAFSLPLSRSVQEGTDLVYAELMLKPTDDTDAKLKAAKDATEYAEIIHTAADKKN